MVLVRAALPLAGLWALSAGLAQQSDYRVKAEFSPAAIDRVLARVDAANDQWLGEQDFEAIDKRLKRISEQLKTGEGEFPPLSETISRFQKLDLVEFKVIGSSRARSEADTAILRVRVELGGTTADGGLLSLLGTMRMTWRRAETGWELANTELGGFKESSAPRFHFTDITEAALGHNPSYRKQLALGTDHWRTVLDGAVGVNVYGNHGLSAGDYNGDGFEDLYISQPAGLPNRLYRNNGDSTFTDVTGAAGVDVLDDTSMSLFADADNDGDQDLILIGPNQPLLLRNGGKGRFRLDRDSGFRTTPQKSAMLTGAAMADYDNDGDLDLYVCSYDFWQAGSEYDTPTPYYDATNGPPNFLFRNRGDGTFEDVTETAGLMANNNRFSFAPAWGDYDNDGDQDLYVANDFGRNNLYRNNGDGTFTDVAAAAGVEDMAAGMSAAWGDSDGDGDLDLYVGNMWSSAGQRLTHNEQFQGVAASEEVRRSFQRHARGNSLFRNDGDGTFSDVTLESGVEMGRWAWSSDFVDLNNDGHQDIYVQNGYISGADSGDL